jgi:hypothetical protein
MIKGVMSGAGITVQGGQITYPYIPHNSNNPIQGMIRVNGQDIQAFDGSTWMTLSPSWPTIELNGETQSILQWAREQKIKQAEREARIKKNPALQKAFENIKRAEENFDIIDALVKDYVHEEETTQGP